MSFKLQEFILMCNDKQVELSYIQDCLTRNKGEFVETVKGCPAAYEAFCSRLPPDDLSMLLDPYRIDNIEKQQQGFIVMCNNTQNDLAHIDYFLRSVPNLCNIVNDCPAAVAAYRSRLSPDMLSVVFGSVSKQL